MISIQKEVPDEPVISGIYILMYMTIENNILLFYFSQKLLINENGAYILSTLNITEIFIYSIYII